MEVDIGRGRFFTASPGGGRDFQWRVFLQPGSRWRSNTSEQASCESRAGFGENLVRIEKLNRALIHFPTALANFITPCSRKIFAGNGIQTFQEPFRQKRACLRGKG